MQERPIYLCGGTQSSGSTLISWCFLQRSDMDGMLDARFDTLPQIPPKLLRQLPWCKFTVACFRFSEVYEYLQHEGWSPRPLLVVRDVRSVFNSLITKTYGRNGVTADDPPLRTRLKRFLQDWQMFRENGWPILKYEEFTQHPEETLRAACRQLELPWDPAMASWPKPIEQITDANFGNETFVNSRGGTLTQTVVPSLTAVKTDRIPPSDLQWLEQEFAEMNRETGYPEHIPSTAPATLGERAIPRFENTRRYARIRRQTRFSRTLSNMVTSVTGLWKK